MYVLSNQSISSPVVHRLLVSSRQFLHFTAPCDVKFLSLITRSTSLSHFTSSCHHLRLPPTDQVIIPLVHLPCYTRTRCPCHINTLFSNLYKILLLPFFLVLRHFLTTITHLKCNEACSVSWHKTASSDDTLNAQPNTVCAAHSLKGFSWCRTCSYRLNIALRATQFFAKFQWRKINIWSRRKNGADF